MSINAKPWESAGGAATVPDASETTKGKIRIATSTEAATGTDDLTAMTPFTVKERIDAALVGGVEYKGSYTGQSLVTAEQGDMYISAATYSLAGVSLLSGDHIIFSQDAADPVTSAMFDKIDNTDAVSSVNTLTGAVVLSGDDIAADHSASNYTPANANIDGHLSGIDSALASVGGNQITLIDTKSIDFTAASNAIYDIQSSLTVTMPGSPSEGDLIGFAAQGTATPSLTVSGTLETVNNVQTTSTTIEVNKRVVVWWGYNGARWQQLNDSLKVATASLAGVLETASNTETAAATATDRALTPSNIGSIDLSDADNTTSGFISGITGESLNDLSDVSYTAGAGIDNYVLTYDHSATSWGAEAVPSAASASETVAGVIEIATNAEAAAGTATDKALVPSNISSVDLSQADNTTSGFISGITGENLNDLSDVSFTAGAGIDNYVLTYDNSTTSWGAEAVPSASAASETVAGVIEIATNAEAAAGTATDKALVPSNISSVDLSQADNTTSGFISGITGESLNDLSDVSFTAGAGIDNYVLTYDNSSTSWGAEVAPTASAASETVAGVIEIATNAEAAAGTATDKALVPSNISSVDLSQADNTTSGFISGITGESLNDLSDVSYTAGAGIDNYVLTYDHSTTSWGAEAASGGLSAVVDDTTPQLGGALDVNGQAITSASNGNVTINPDGTGDISVGADIIPDANATHSIGDEDNRFISLYSDINGAIRFKAKNDQGSAITKGQVVYIKGVNGDVPTVGLARANSASTMPGFGLALANANDQAEVQVITFGNLTAYDTTTYSLSLGDTVYVSAATAGALTNSAPTGESNLIQNVGKVVRASATEGQIKVGGAGRAAATPNLNDGKIFLGNASNQAVSTALSSAAVTSFNTQTGALTIGGDDLTADHTASNYTPANANIDGHLSGIDSALALKAPLASPSLTGTPTAPTATQGDNSTQLATTAYVDTAVSGAGGGTSYTYDAITAGTTTAQAWYHYSVDTSGGAVTINLPALSGLTDGDEIRVKLRDATNSVTIDANASENIDGGLTYTLDVAYQAVTLVAGSTEWEII